LAAILALPAAAKAQDAIPAGTILPISLDKSIDAGKVHPGQQIQGAVMQDIPGTFIRRGAKVLGHVVGAKSLVNGPAKLEICFDNVKSHGHIIPIKTNLRALASYLEVEEAQIPEDMSSRGLTPETWTTQQIGGDQVYRGGGPVAVGTTTVGEPTPYGVLGDPRLQPGMDCRGVVAEAKRPQAFWLFSTDACGLYGYPNLRIEHAGRTDPAGTIVFASDHGKLLLRVGSGMLLRVQNSSENSPSRSEKRKRPARR
jgi:hypothetical protein